MNRPALQFIAFCVGLALFTSAPIWGVQYFIHQDGSGHVHTAWTMLELLRGEQRALELYQFNLLTFPNVVGHWIQAASLLFVSPFVSTKLMLSVSYLGLVASIGWLRWCTAGRDGLWLSVLIGAVIGFNWIWLVGAYNFTLGLALAFIATGCYYKWQAELSAQRIAMLAGIAALAFLCHIIAFVLVCAAVGTICIIPSRSLSLQKILRTAVIFFPALPLLVLYVSSTEAGGNFYPIWARLANPISPLHWIDQVRTADPLFLLRRTAFPFVETETKWFLMFAPVIWLAVAAAMLMLSTFRKKRGVAVTMPFVVLAAGFLLLSFLGPDELQYSSSTGGLMRQRWFLAGIGFLVPLFRSEHLGRVSKTIAAAALSFTVIYQTAALWEFAIRSDRDAREYFSALEAIPQGASLGGVVIEPRTFRFAVSHMASMNNYNAILRSASAWDNYEFAQYLFPVVMRNGTSREFVLRFASNNGYDLSAPESLAAGRIAELERCLASTDPRIDTLVIWGSYAPIDEIVGKHFTNGPSFQHGRARVFRR